MIRQRIMRGVGANVVDKLVIAGMQLLVVPILITAWGLPVYGRWVILWTIPSLLAFSDLGFATAAGNDMTMQVARGERQRALCTFQSARVAILAASALLILAGSAMIWLAPDKAIVTATGFSATEMQITMTLLMIYGIACLQSTATFAGFRCAGMFSTGVLCHAVIFLSENLIAIAAVLAGASPAVTAGCYLVGRMSGSVIQAILLQRRVPWLNHGFGHVAGAEIRRLLRPAAAVVAIPLAQSVVLQGTALAIGIAVSATAVPAFTTVRTLSRLGLTATSLLSTAVMPEYSASAARGERHVQAKLLTATVLGGTIVTLPFALGLGLLGQFVVTIWTRGAIHPSAGLLWTMAATTLVGGLWSPLSNLLIARNLHTGFAYPYLLLSLIAVALAFVLAHLFGATGAAMALLALDLLMAALITRIASRLGISLVEARGVAHDILVGALRKVRRSPA